MYKYLLEHESYIKSIIDSKEKQDWNSIKEYHKSQIVFLQHERLVHLMVTLFFAILLVTTYIVTVIYTQTALLVLDLIVTVLEIFYIIHYYRLENGIQRWYVLYNKICDRQKNDPS